MTDVERLEDRIAAVERATLDGDHDFGDLAELASVVEAVEGIEDRLDDLAERVADLEARTESVESYVANVDSVNEDVERQAAAAAEAADALEARIEDLERESRRDVDRSRPSTGGEPTAADGPDLADEPERRAAAILDGGDRDGDATTADGSDLSDHVPDPPGEPLGRATREGVEGGAARNGTTAGGGERADGVGGTSATGYGRERADPRQREAAVTDGGAGVVAADQRTVRERFGDVADEESLLSTLASKFQSW